ncbi:MAG: sec-independent translocase [Propionicimonas sp.]
MPLDFNMSEIMILAVLAVIIFGPEKLPELARKTARVLNYVRNIANDAKGQLRQELGPEFDDIRLADLNPKLMVQKHLLNPVQSAVEPVRAELAPVKATLAGSAAAAASVAAVASEPAGPAEPQPVVDSGVVRFDTEAT